MKEITIDSAFVLMVIEGAQKQGLDCESILLRNKISRLALNKPASRVPLNAFAALTAEIMHELNDEFLGLANKPQPLGSFNMLCRSCISAQNIIRSLKRCSKFWNLFNNTYQHHVEVHDAGYAYTCLLYTSPSPRDQRGSRMPSSA